MSKHTEKLELIDIDKLIPYANNARTHSDEQIKKIQASLREFGFVNPVLIDKDCGIIAGHGRVEAAKREGMTEVPCVWVEHLTETQKKAYILADNRLALDAGWDDNILRLELSELNEMDFDISITGFDDEDIPQNNIIDIDDMLTEIDTKTAIKKPLWATIRTLPENKETLEQALGILEKNGIRVERSYEK